MMFSNPINYEVHRKPIRKIEGISLTIPDQTMPLREILDRYSRGLPLLGNPMPPVYEDETESLGVDPRVLDISEVHNMVQSTNKTITEAKNAEMKKTIDAKKKAERDALKREIEAELKASATPVE